MQCSSCKGTLEIGRTSYTVNRHGYHLIIDDMPAYICTQCNEALFTEEAVSLVQDMIRTLDLQRSELNAIPMFA